MKDIPVLVRGKAIAPHPLVWGGCPGAQSVGVGYSHSCALDNAGQVRCWGANQEGQLGLPQVGTDGVVGDNEFPSTVDPVALGDEPGEEPSQIPAIDLGDDAVVVDIETDTARVCAILDSGALYCWGWNEDGQLGYGHTDPIGDDETPASAGPVDVALLGRQQRWAPRLRPHREDRRRRAPEQRRSRRARRGDHRVRQLPQPRMRPPRHRGGALRCWGRNFLGELGYGHSQAIGDDELPQTAGDVPWQP